MTTTTFDFRALVRDALTKSANPNPHAVVEDLIARLDHDERGQALRLALPDYVRTLSAQPLKQSPKGKRNTPTSVQRIAAWYSAKLAERLFTGTEWKFFADLTSDDLHGSAKVRYEAAANTHAEGDRLVKIADHMDEHGYETAADISEHELRELLGEATS